jgi:hypothetical protein
VTGPIPANEGFNYAGFVKKVDSTPDRAALDGDLSSKSDFFNKANYAEDDLVENAERYTKRFEQWHDIKNGAAL